MLDALLRSAGLTPQAVADGRARFEKLACVLEDLARMHAQEYGQPIRDGTAPAHSPARLPHFELVELAAGAATVVDLEAALGKPANRGHLANLGEEEVTVQFVGLRGDELSSAYHLPPAAVLDTSSWITRRVRITAGATEVARVQILAQ